MAAPVTVAVVDDHPVVIEGVSTWIAQDPAARVRLVSAGSSVESATTGAGCHADVVVLDLELDGRLMIEELAKLVDGGRRVIVFSQHAGEDLVRSALDAGASAYLTKQEGQRYLVDAIVATAQDRPAVPPAMAGVILADHRPKLAPQERTALLLWFQCRSKAAVAERMGIRETTAKQYIDRARVKYGQQGRHAASKAALLARAIEDGLIRADEIADR
ncbi:response regulator [Kribbella sp. NPDC005582]|uniref:response regulator transcription factor n=1 Tax=Kribbella sp. NPDC005582 TaxID=3156893 RepID=UPI0033B8C9DE